MTPPLGTSCVERYAHEGGHSSPQRGVSPGYVDCVWTARTQVGDQVGDQVRAQVGDQVGDRDQFGGQVGDCPRHHNGGLCENGLGSRLGLQSASGLGLGTRVRVTRVRVTLTVGE